jgi:hypothetical protein
MLMLCTYFQAVPDVNDEFVRLSSNRLGTSTGHKPGTLSLRRNLKTER